MMNTKLACYRNGIYTTGENNFKNLGDCPNYGSSDCPITMDSQVDNDCYCCSEEFYNELKFILKFKNK